MPALTKRSLATRLARLEKKLGVDIYDEEELRKENIAKRERAIDLQKFDAQIRGDDSGLTVLDLKKLDSVKKKHYIDNLIEEDNVLHEFL